MDAQTLLKWSVTIAPIGFIVAVTGIATLNINTLLAGMALFILATFMFVESLNKVV